MAGTKNTSIRSYNFFSNLTLASGGYNANEYEFIDLDDGTPFLSQSILIINDGGSDLNFRFTPDPGGGASHGLVKTTESLQLDFKRATRIYLSGTAALAVRLWAW